MPNTESACGSKRPARSKAKFLKKCFTMTVCIGTHKSFSEIRNKWRHTFHKKDTPKEKPSPDFDPVFDEDSSMTDTLHRQLMGELMKHVEMKKLQKTSNMFISDEKKSRETTSRFYTELDILGNEKEIDDEHLYEEIDMLSPSSSCQQLHTYDKIETVSGNSNMDLNELFCPERYQEELYMSDDYIKILPLSLENQLIVAVDRSEPNLSPKTRPTTTAMMMTMQQSDNLGLKRYVVKEPAIQFPIAGDLKGLFGFATLQQSEEKFLSMQYPKNKLSNLYRITISQTEDETDKFFLNFECFETYEMEAKDFEAKRAEFDFWNQLKRENYGCKPQDTDTDSYFTIEDNNIVELRRKCYPESNDGSFCFWEQEQNENYYHNAAFQKVPTPEPTPAQTLARTSSQNIMQADSIVKVRAFVGLAGNNGNRCKEIPQEKDDKVTDEAEKKTEEDEDEDEEDNPHLHPVYLEIRRKLKHCGILVLP